MEQLSDKEYIIFEDGSKSMRDWTVGEMFDKMCVKLDLDDTESVVGLLKGRCPVTGEIRGLKLELMRV